MGQLLPIIWAAMGVLTGIYGVLLGMCLIFGRTKGDLRQVLFNLGGRQPE